MMSSPADNVRATGARPRHARIAGLALVFVASLAVSVAAGFNFDEVWFLQVVDRVTRGDVLYRDVFYLSTPLPVQVTALLVRLFGSELVVEKVVTTCAFVAELAFADAIARACGIGRRARWAVWLALFVYTQHFPNPPYRTIGSAFLFAAFWALLEWLRPQGSAKPAGRDRWLALCGVFAGLSFSAMPNHGLLTLASAAVVIGVRAYDDGDAARSTVRALTVLASSFLAVVCVCLAPVILSGSIPSMLEYTVFNKGPYLQDVGVSWSGEIRSMMSPNALANAAAFSKLYRGLHVLLVPVSLAAVIAAWLRAPRGARAHATAVVLLVCSAVAGAYPRMNRFHLSYASPAIIVGLVFASTRLFAPGPRLRAGICVLSLAWLIPGVALTLGGAIHSVRSGDRVWSSLPHFKGIRVFRDEDARIQANARRLRDALDPAAYIIGPHATLYRLVADIRNPTPFDEFSLMGFGRHGQGDVIARLRQGELRPVCLEPSTVLPSPDTLIQFVRTSLVAGEDLGVCVVYR